MTDGDLAGERRATAARIAAMERDLAHVVEAATLVATDDEHDPEGSTIAFDRAQLQAVLDQARRHLGAIDTAVERQLAGTYGTCERCGEPIPAARLEARPATARCVACADAPLR